MSKKIDMGLAVSDDEMLNIFLPIFAYWIYSGIYAILETKFENYKLHTREEEEKNLVSRTTVIKGVLSLQTIQVFVAFLLLKVTEGNDDRGASKGEQPSPSSFLIIARQFIVAMLIVDTFQYFTHRFIHHNKYLYRHMHSYHHRLVVTYSFAAAYNHTVGGLLLDTVGGSLAAFLSGMSTRTSTFFFCLATIKGVDDHCGLLLPGNPFRILFWNNTAYHDVHHQIYGGKYNFSTPFFVIWDKILGTYMPYSIEKRAGGGFELRPMKQWNKDN